MASPQLEDGFTRIANEIMEALARINLSPYESRALWFILRKTYGYGKKQDWIASSQMRAGLGGLDRRNISRAVKSLIDRNMIVVCRDNSGRPNYSFQKDYSKWRASSREMTGVICRDDKRHLYGHTVSSVETHTKETLTKENSNGVSENPEKISVKKLHGKENPYQQAIKLYHDRFLQKVGHKPAITKGDGQQLKDRLGSHDLETVLAAIKYYFDDPDDFSQANGLNGLKNIVGANGFNKILSRMKHKEASRRAY